MTPSPTHPAAHVLLPHPPAPPLPIVACCRCPVTLPVTTSSSSSPLRHLLSQSPASFPLPLPVPTIRPLSRGIQGQCDSVESQFDCFINHTDSVNCRACSVNSHSEYDDCHSGTVSNHSDGVSCHFDSVHHFSNDSTVTSDNVSDCLDRDSDSDSFHKYSDIVNTGTVRNLSDSVNGLFSSVSSCSDIFNSRTVTVTNQSDSARARFNLVSNCSANVNTHCDNVSHHSHGVNSQYFAGRGGLLHSLVIAVTLCRTCVILPAVSLLLLLLQLRRKGRRRRATQVPHVLFILCLLLSHCLASPWIEEGAHSVKLRGRYCQPVPDEHLRSMLGPAFDPDRMSSDDPFAGAKRSDPDLEPEIEDAAWDSYFYADDDPDSGRYVNEDFVDIVRDRGEEEEAWFSKEVMDKDGVQVEKKGIVKKEGQFYQKEGRRLVSNQAATTSYPHPSYLFMKRRKRATSPSDDDYIPDSSSASSKDKKNTDSSLHLRLTLSGRNRRLRRKLKKVFRKKARKLGKKAPPWACSMKKAWGRLKEGFYPRYVLDGRCMSDKCFYRLYDCVPQKYRLKLLKRDPDFCNPLPTLGANSTFEQKWSVVRYYVTVGCNCEAADPQRRPLGGRRRKS